MSYFYDDIEVDGAAFIDLNEQVIHHGEEIIKLFTDEDLKEELQKREDGNSKFENYIYSLSDVYTTNITCEVSTRDVLYEISNEDLLNEIYARNLHIDYTDYTSDISKYEIRGLICKGLGINEFWDDEEIFEMLREIWKVSRYAIK